MHLAYRTGFYEFNDSMIVVGGVNLRTELEYTPVFLLIFQHSLAFSNVVRQRFLAIIIFARVERKHSNLCMPVIRCCDGNSVDVPTFNDATEVVVSHSLCVRLKRCELGQRAVKVTLVQVAKGNDIDIRQRSEPFHMLIPHATKSDVSNSNAVARRR